MTECIVAKQIAEHCNQPEQNSASELYQKLCNDEIVFIGGESYELNDITEALIEDSESLLDAVQSSITDNPLAVHQLYIKTIQELMEK